MSSWGIGLVGAAVSGTVAIAIPGPPLLIVLCGVAAFAVATIVLAFVVSWARDSEDQRRAALRDDAQRARQATGQIARDYAENTEMRRHAGNVANLWSRQRLK